MKIYKKKCCAKEISSILSTEPNKHFYLKLYDTICDACNETEKFALYPLHIIINLNNIENRPTGIVCRDCQRKECKSEGCVISLLAKVFDNTHSNSDYLYSKTNKLEIIYI